MQPGQTVTPGGETKPPEDQSPLEHQEALPDDTGAVSWSASEFVAHQKPRGWFALLGTGVLVSGALVFFVTHSILPPVTIVVLGVALGFMASRAPRTLQYRVDSSGVAIGQRFYSYEEFKTFSIVEEGPLHSMLLMPLKRFMPAISIYYEPDDEDKITRVVADYLPFADAPRDSIDSLMRRLRF